MKKCILLVDDDPDILSTTESFLRKRDYDVVTAANGQEALVTARANRPDLILTDVLMPQMDGYAFYKELKNDASLNNVPVLVITGRGKMEDSFKVVGVDGFITKPFTGEDLAREIEHIFILTETRQHSAGASPAVKKGKKVLALAHEKTVADDMIYQAQRAGYQLVVVSSGAETIAKIVSFLPNVIVIDVQPKDMSAYALVDILQKLPQCADHPMLGYSYYSTDQLGESDVRQKMLSISGESERFLRAGGTKYIGRYNHQVFITALAETLGKKR